MKIAIIGATGMVGQKMIEVLQERNFPVTELYPVASEKSLDKEILFKNNKIKVCSIKEALKKKVDIALFSAGADVSKEWAPIFEKAGTFVIDNSSAWRMHPDILLIVPEINAHLLNSSKRKIIANPNCSTIQLLMPLFPLEKKYGIKRIVVSTYQSVTGTGYKAVKQLENERRGEKTEMIYPYQIDLNCLPHCDAFEDNGYTKEEMKLVNESKKILQRENLLITATAVRVPVLGGHSESVNIELMSDFDLEDIRKIFFNCKGIIVQDNIDSNTYPMPLYCKDKDEVFVGRIRRDYSVANGLNLWIVADNLRKGAATNAVQIAECISKNF